MANMIRFSALTDLRRLAHRSQTVLAIWQYRKKTLFPIMPSSTVLAIGGIIGKSFFPIMPKMALSEKNGSFGPSVGKVSCLR